MLNNTRTMSSLYFLIENLPFSEFLALKEFALLALLCKEINSSVKDFTKWPSIISLGVSGSSKIDNMIEYFQNCNKPMHLRFKGITNRGLECLTSMLIHNLDLKRCVITDSGLAHLSDMPIRNLYLNYCLRITDRGLAHLSSMPLQILDLRGCGVTDAGLDRLKLLPLRELYLNRKSKVTCAMIGQLRKRLELFIIN